ncbi:lysylphosphatidylglycerol synthase domain-containing protein [Aquabacterium sp. J223]|uniref:lysylphosphatidylglycerol synthase domain-containing protein n=1 Tax=Aquabacterium sp. J223 TaxID=2898431 RepID=UPI0021AD8263|nr:lysylphosphatidylglycerol synthase domain-containing protein [Aquabacterium sp. J223]UUX97497.1 lysylphosphatidylglycerol synthase domain-containing protein [Aquabacterium sp. J223]
MNRAAVAAAPQGRSPVPAPAWRRRLLRAVGLAFMAGVLWLLWRLGRAVPWDEVWQALRGLHATTLLAAAAVALASYAVYAGYELLARRALKHRLGLGTTAAIAYATYSLNLNLGAWVGGLGLRLRLYTRLGLSLERAVAVYGLVALTNWSGYFLLAGTAFALRALELPESWRLGEDGLQWIGFGLLALLGTYLGACAFARQRAWTLRGRRLELPALGIALQGLVLSTVNWMLMAGVIWVLLRPTGVAYPPVLAGLLMAAIAGAATHIPGGLGVVEAVFVALLGHKLPEATLLGALLGYRALYYLLPLPGAVLSLAALEAQARRRQRAAA